MRQNTLAAAVVLHNDHVLLVRRSMRESFLPGVWGVPCGKLDLDEDPEEAVLRELKEETGLSGKVRRFTGCSGFTSEFEGQPVDNIQNNFLVRPLDFHVVLPEPDQDFRWVPTVELDRAGLDDHNLKTIRQALGEPR
ncbi:MAG TPA: NUDIX hydrolase [Streptosporangiaceae bacterium]|nr:NUDIX hydrolase [Streptosporangiaceae bacterium]